MQRILHTIQVKGHATAAKSYPCAGVPPPSARPLKHKASQTQRLPSARGEYKAKLISFLPPRRMIKRISSTMLNQNSISFVLVLLKVGWLRAGLLCATVALPWFYLRWFCFAQALLCLGFICASFASCWYCFAQVCFALVLYALVLLYADFAFRKFLLCPGFNCASFPFR